MNKLALPDLVTLRDCVDFLRDTRRYGCAPLIHEMPREGPDAEQVYETFHATLLNFSFFLTTKCAFAWRRAFSENRFVPASQTSNE